jgi:hypothetical protein
MIKEIDISSSDDIVKFANQLTLSVSNIKEIGWYKKFICMENNKNYINSISTYRSSDFIVNNNLLNMIKYITNIMNNNGFNYDISDIELHYANTNNNYITPWSDIHTDNDNLILVNTFICYFDVDC